MAFTPELFLILMHLVSMTDNNLSGLRDGDAWRSRLMADGSERDGYFVAGVRLPSGDTIACFLPDRFWAEIDRLEILCDTLPYAKKHTELSAAMEKLVAERFAF